MKHGLVAASALVVLGLVAFGLLHSRTAVEIDPIAELEAGLARQGFRLARLDTDLPPGAAVVRYALSEPSPLSGFYLRHTAQKQSVMFQQLDSPPQAAGKLSVYPSAIVRDPGDGSPPDEVAAGEGWELFELIPPGGSPCAAKTIVHEFEMADGFMRKNLGGDDGWRPVAGNWQLKQYGGGLPVEDSQKANPGFQRAVNPFSMIGWAPAGQHATVLYETPVSHGDGYLAEARFYFGSPGKPLDTSARKQPLPTFLIAQGELDGPQAGFGWWAEKPGGPERWSLCFRQGNGSWKVLRSWPKRPPRSTWTRVGVAVADGHVATAMLDGRELGRTRLDAMVSGSFHIHTGPEARKLEVDDIAAHPFAQRREDYGQPVYVKSRNFADKTLYGRGRDPVEFDYWAKAANAFIQASGPDSALGLTGHRGTVRMPLYGDFTYKSMPDLPRGEYRFIVLKKLIALTSADKAAEFKFTKTVRGWLSAGSSSAVFTLELGRRDGRFAVRKGNEWQPLGPSYEGPAHLMIVPPGNFRPEQHGLYSKCTWNELFEQSPAEWYWHDGMFGMNTRWSCQPKWNFMAGQSHALAAFFSKAAYYGDQQIDCFMSLRGVVPGERQYYIRRDLCVSFCSNGRDLDSGYALIFAAERNAKTLLLKRGEVIASTTDPKFLFPKGTNHSEVHWLWWNFDIKKADGRIVVKLNGNAMFDVADPAPIEGGHVALWTVGNGFVASRVNVAAQRRVESPQAAAAQWQEREYTWKPLHPDAVLLRETVRGLEVRNPAGGGMFAVRAHTQVDLSSTPILELPMRLDPDAKINLHLEINGRPWVVRISSPLQNMEYLLTPSAEKAFLYGRPVIKGARLKSMMLGDAAPSEGVLRIDIGGMLKQKNVSTTGIKQITLTIGNSSNAGYLLAGFWGNHAGTTYCVGEPKWVATGQ